jgi:O-acetyl-ADP-ribose deacetylase (regulator of RNase III)
VHLDILLRVHAIDTMLPCEEIALMEKRLGGILVQTYIGNITTLSVDAVVNAANSDLRMGSGVAGAIKRKGGDVIEQEAMAQGPINPGEAVITSAGTLSAKHVIHCAGMSPGKPATYDSVKSSVREALRLASENNLTSIAFPAIGAGVGELSKEQSAKAIIEAIEDHSINAGSVKEVFLVSLGPEVNGAFKLALKFTGAGI